MPIGEWVHAEVERLLGTFDGVEVSNDLIVCGFMHILDCFSFVSIAICRTTTSKRENT